MTNTSSGKLIPVLGLFSAFILTVSSVIGSGIYKKIAVMAGDLSSPSLVLLCWLLAGFITLCGALSNAEIASMLADSGGEYVYYRKIYNRFFAFLYGWTSFAVIRSASLASIAYVCAESLNTIVPLPQFNPSLSEMTVLGIFTPFNNFGVKSMTIFILAVLSVVNCFGLKGGERLSRLVLYGVMISLLVIIILGFTLSDGSMQNVQTVSSNYVSTPWYSGQFIKSMFAALLAAFWAYEGWATTGYIGGEIKNPNRNLPLALVFGVSFVMVVYILVNLTFLYVLPIDKIAEVGNSENGIVAVEVVRHFLGNSGVIFISALIFMTTLGTTNTTLIMPPRLYFAMAREGHFFKSTAYIHPKYHTPTKAFIYQLIWASILVLSGSFDQLTDMLIFAAFIFYGATTLGVFILRYKMPLAHRPYKAYGYPVIPALFILFCASLVIATFLSRPREALLGLGLMASGIPFFFYWRKQNKDKENTV